MSRQVATIAYRCAPAGDLEVLLVTSRRTGRWIIPKGTVQSEEMTVQAAERKALEEAGIVGRVTGARFATYIRRNSTGDENPTHVDVFLLTKSAELPVWREMHSRRRSWFGIEEAIRIVSKRNIRLVLISLKGGRTQQHLKAV